MVLGRANEVKTRASEGFRGPACVLLAEDLQLTLGDRMVLRAGCSGLIRPHGA